MASSPPRKEAPLTKPHITYGDLHRYLYAKTSVRPIRVEDLKRKVMEYQQANILGGEKTSSKHPPASLQTGLSVSYRSLDPKRIPKLSRALESFPEEVQLCVSSLPGVVYGVCAKTHIPIGTWIGPYEGRQVKTSRTWLGQESSYMWEIFQGGKLSFYLDGSDEESSSWMRFISCARNSTEQNLYAFQYCGNIYYRAFKEIPPGTELLVWYDEIYPQFMGIPLEIRETEGIYQRAGGFNKTDNEVVVVVPPHIHKPTPHARQPVHPTSSCTYPALPDVSSVNTAPRTSRQLSSPFNPADFPLDGRSRLSWQPPGNSIPPLVPGCHPEPTSDLLKRRKRARSARADFSWQLTANVPTSPGTELLLKRPKSGIDTSWQQPSSSSAPPGSQVEPLLPEESVIPGSDPYDLRIQLNTSSEPNQTLNNQSRFTNERAGSSTSSGETRKKPEGINEDNAFQCGQCGRTFPQRSVLQIHVCPKAPYKPYHCGHCSKLFSDPNELRNHAIVHINEKPFKCGYCSRSFSGATTLNNHIRTHTGEKPFECSVCGKTFSQASQLSRHEKIPGDCVRK